MTYLSLDELDLAENELNAALKLCSEVRDAKLEALALSNLGFLVRRQGDLDRARALYERAAELFERLGQRPDLCQILNNLGGVYQRLGKPLNTNVAEPLPTRTAFNARIHVVYR